MASKVTLPSPQHLLRVRYVGLTVSEYDEQRLTLVLLSEKNPDHPETYRVDLSNAAHSAWFRRWLNWQHILDGAQKHQAVCVDFTCGQYIPQEQLDGGTSSPVADFYKQATAAFEKAEQARRSSPFGVSRFGSIRGASTEVSTHGDQRLRTVRYSSDRGNQARKW